MEFIKGDYLFIDFNEEYEKENLEPYYIELRNEYDDSRGDDCIFFYTHKEALNFAHSFNVPVMDNIYKGGIFK